MFVRSSLLCNFSFLTMSARTLKGQFLTAPKKASRSSLLDLLYELKFSLVPELFRRSLNRSLRLISAPAVPKDDHRDSKYWVGPSCELESRAAAFINEYEHRRILACVEP